MTSRKATHAGSWYTNSESELSNQLSSWLQECSYGHGPARALITPHAGYRYCGPCAAHAYKQISPEIVKRFFILGPSHHYGLSGCALTTVIKYKTPFYDLLVDSTINKELYTNGHFEWVKLSVEEREHSIEMQLPFIAKVMESYKDQFTIVPILVGALTRDKQQRYGKIFAKYLKDPQNLFVISSDFCHWGPQFRFTYYDASRGQIYESIKHLDHLGMNIIECLNSDEFNDYLKKYSNTICGRHAIGILLQMTRYYLKDMSNGSATFKFLKYTQSNHCVSFSDSSVSYAAGALTIN